MTDTPLDLDYIEHRMASPMVTYRESVEEDMPALVAALRKAEAQVAAVLALCDEAAPRRMGDGYLSASVLAPEDVRAAVDGAVDVPMSPNTGHDLRERIAQRIAQAWAEAKDRAPLHQDDTGYRDGYLDGLEHAEGIARSTPLTEDGAS